MTTPRATWHAYADGTGHAFLAGPAGIRSLCGDVRRLEERHDHPIARRCDVCTAELNERTKAVLRPGDQVTAGWTETERRGAWGDR